MLAPKERFKMTVPADITIADSVYNPTSGMNTCLDKSRDTVFYADLPAEKSLNTFTNFFTRSGICKRIIELPVMTAIAAGWQIVYHHEDNNIINAKVNKLYCDLNLRSELIKAFTYARIYGGASLALNFNNKPNTESPLSPFDLTLNSLKSVTAFDRYRLASAGSLDYDMSTPHYYNPLYYIQSMNGNYDSSKGAIQKASLWHHSRLITVNSTVTPTLEYERNGYWDDPVIYACSEGIKLSEEIEHHVRYLCQELNIDVLTSDQIIQVSQTNRNKDAQDIINYTNKCKSNYHMLVLASAEKFERHSINATPIKEMWEIAKDLICSSVGISAETLFGTRAGGLNSTDASTLQNLDQYTINFRDNILAPVFRQVNSPWC